MMLMPATALLLCAALALGWLRLWRAHAPPARRGRFWALMLLQPVAGGLMWLALFPPPQPGRANPLVVATAGARGVLDNASVILPEAQARGGRPLPDLATALRTTGARRVQILGSGLEPRDQDAARGVEIMFQPPPPAAGVAALAVAGPVAVGLPMQVVGRATATPGSRIELLDPAGAVAARMALPNGGRFALQGLPRAAGPADWQVRLLDRTGNVQEQLLLPVAVPIASPVRLLLQAGAPGPELKYLRRWATDAGMQVSSRIAIGGGVVLGDQSAGFGREALARADALVLDERSWADLPPPGRQAVLSAVRAGMGLVLRITGPIPENVRREWRAIAPAVIGDDAMPRQIGGKTALSALRLGMGAADIVVARDETGAALAAWRALGRGRVAIWPVQDAQALVLMGDTARFEMLWSRVLAAVARPVGGRATVPAIGFVGERLVLCAPVPANRRDAKAKAAADEATITGPDGQVFSLLFDASGCAAIWPRAPGWFTLVMGQGPPQPVRVLPATAWPGVRAAQRSMATLALSQSAPARAGAQGPAPATPMPPPAGPPWGWALLLLGVLALMWGLERSGRRQAA